ncbi:helix-turn-helix domain-containing protein [Geomonas nitrogeniifigens]|uniref:Helix-turn-helix domain-containing protein n=1 Tax=Geomonas diazotrophica TaxID=2843197 RepID=A0ABX8JIZ1_9BACT|nr:helix-turn-helix domain-containing protein [Geomonas nitrogeniifigens]QWV97472.1 helix-turn-helix domain-containing protein [Geomonas nitrogeniifigens]
MAQRQELPAVLSPTMRTEEAAKYLNVRPATLEQWRWNGRGPSFVKIGRSVRYRLTDLDDFLNSRVFRSTTEAQAA